MRRFATSSLTGAAIWLAVMLMGPPATAQVLTDRTNAATWYQRAIDSFAKVSEEQQHVLRSYDGGVPTPALRAALSKAGPALSAMRAATGRRSSDFELDLSEGFNLLLPHLSPLRQIQSTFAAAAMVNLHDGDGTAAVKGVMAMITASGDLCSDQTIISSLVARSMFDMAETSMDQLGAFGELDKEAAIALRRRLNRLDADDPFGIGDAMEGERTVLSAVAEDFSVAMEEGVDTIDLSDLLPEGTFSGEDLSVSPEGLAPAIEGLSALTEDLAAVTLNPDIHDATVQWEKIESQLAEGDYGPLASLVAPSLGRILEMLEESRATVEARLGMLNGIISGDVDPVDSLNAAAFYLKAAGQLTGAPLTSQSAIDMIIASDADVIEPELILEYRRLGDITEPLHKAMLATRCDFAAIVGDTSEALITTWIPGQRLLSRYLLASTMLAIESGDDPLTWADLHTAHALDMGRQHHLTASLVAATSISEAIAMDEPRLQGPLPDTMVRLARATAADPLGLDRSLGRTRSEIAQGIDRRVRFPEGTAGDQSEIDALIESAAATDADALLAWMANHEEDSRRQQGQAAVVEDRSLLADVLSIAAITVVTSREFQEQAASLDLIASLPTIADIEEIRARLRSLMPQLEVRAAGPAEDDDPPVSE